MTIFWPKYFDNLVCSHHPTTPLPPHLWSTSLFSSTYCEKQNLWVILIIGVNIFSSGCTQLEYFSGLWKKIQNYLGYEIMGPFSSGVWTENQNFLGYEFPFAEILICDAKYITQAYICPVDYHLSLIKHEARKTYINPYILVFDKLRKKYKEEEASR